MSWLRIDDGFPEHPKLVALGKPTDRWTWLELLAYCARRDTNGFVPDGIADVLKRVTPKFLARCEAVGLIDKDADGKRTVHDWRIYNGASLEDRVYSFLSKEPSASANEVQRVTGGNRQAILALVSEFQRLDKAISEVPPRFPTGSESGSAEVPESSERFQSVVPSPAPTPTPEEEPLALGTTDVDLEAGSSAKAAVQHMLGMPGREADPVLRLVEVLPDADADTEHVLRAFRLPEAAYEWARQEVLERGGGSGYAVQVLKRIQAEGQIATPNGGAPAPRSNVLPADPYTAIGAMIANGVLTDQVDLEAEIRGAHLPDAQADQLRAELAAQA